MYPLHMKLAAPFIGFALANTEDEHKALSAAGYQPPYVAPVKTREQLLEEAKDKGLKVDGRWSDERLAEELAKA